MLHVKDSNGYDTPDSAEAVDLSNVHRVVYLKPLNQLFAPCKQEWTQNADYACAPELNTCTSSGNADEASKYSITQCMHIKLISQLRPFNCNFICLHVLVRNLCHNKEPRTGAWDDGIHYDLVLHWFVFDLVGHAHAGAGVHKEWTYQNDQGACYEKAHIACKILPIWILLVKPED